MPSRLLQYVSYQGSEEWCLGPYSSQSRCSIGIQSKHCHYSAWKEPVITWRRPVSVYFDAPYLPPSPDDVCAASDLQNRGPRWVQGASITTTAVDQFDGAQSNGTGFGLRSLRYRLSIHAVFRPHWPDRYFGKCNSLLTLSQTLTTPLLLHHL